MDILIHDDPAALGRAAGREAAAALRAAVAARGSATYVVATGASQFATLATLTAEDVPWEKITIFHLDEYAGLSDSHPASFRRYLRERLLERLPRPPAEAISMGVRRILATDLVVCSVPDSRKAAAVRDAVAGPLSPDCPASILRTHAALSLHLDSPAAALLPAAHRPAGA